MDQILDNFIAVALVFLLLSLIVKAVQDILKWFWANKEKALEQTLCEFVGKDASKAIKNKVCSVFGAKDMTVLEHFSESQFSSILEKLEPAALTHLPKELGISEQDVESAKAAAVTQFSNAIAKFQASYERDMAYWVFGVSALVVVLFNANIVAIYEEIRTNSVTRQSLVQIADTRYRTVLENADEDAGEDLGELLQAERQKIDSYLTDAPILMRGIIGGNFDVYIKDLRTYPYLMLPGLVFSVFLVYLGAPFWHDLLSSLLSMKNVLRRKE
jgi:hypothetical protein